MSLQLNAFMTTLQHNIDTVGFISPQIRKRLWIDLLDEQPCYKLFKLYHKETKSLYSIMHYFFYNAPKYRFHYCNGNDAITKFYKLISLDTINLTQKQTLKLIFLYVYLQSLQTSFMPEMFAVWWCKDEHGLCKWCSDTVCVSSEKFNYTTQCCGVLKLTFHEFDDLDKFTQIVLNLNSYCRQCCRPLYTVKDVAHYLFPYDMYFCTVCD